MHGGAVVVARILPVLEHVLFFPGFRDQRWWNCTWRWPTSLHMSAGMLSPPGVVLVGDKRSPLAVNMRLRCRVVLVEPVLVRLPFQAKCSFACFNVVQCPVTDLGNCSAGSFWSRCSCKSSFVALSDSLARLSRLLIGTHSARAHSANMTAYRYSCRYRNRYRRGCLNCLMVEWDTSSIGRAYDKEYEECGFDTGPLPFSVWGA